MNRDLIIEMVKQSEKKQSERKVWSIPLESVLIPFMVATNAHGITKIDREAIGSPVRLARNTDDGTPKISKGGKLITQVAKPIRDHVSAMRQNYIASIVSATNELANDKPTEYEAELKASIKAGATILKRDNSDIRKFNALIKSQADKVLNEAENIVNEADKVGRPA